MLAPATSSPTGKCAYHEVEVHRSNLRGEAGPDEACGSHSKLLRIRDLLCWPLEVCRVKLLSL